MSTGDEPADGEEPAPQPDAKPVLTIRQHTLVREALHVVERAAKRVAKRFRRFFQPEDLLGIGTIELYKAVQDFKPEYNTDFADYAYWRVRCAMVKGVGEEIYQERIRRAVDIASDQFWAYLTDREYDASKHDDEEARRRFRTIANGMLAAAFISGVEEARRSTPESESAERQEYEVAIQALRAALRQMSDADHRLLVLLYRELKNMKEAAEDLGVSHSTVKRRHAAAIERLRDHLLAHGVDQVPRPRVVPEGGIVVAFRAPHAPDDPKPP
ncbi:RNA polymerase sigma factor for flagellar operon [Minicystis rosea]|nr:RNA polymerase sigma factor for flagellar operon [Minicystis rosea]